MGVLPHNSLYISIRNATHSVSEARNLIFCIYHDISFYVVHLKLDIFLQNNIDAKSLKSFRRVDNIWYILNRFLINAHNEVLRLREHR